MANDGDAENGWKILKPGVLLFQTTIGNLDKPIPHPVLDDSSKMMRIIANPMYEKLTIARAAQIRKNVRPLTTSLLSRTREPNPLKAMRPLEREQTIMKSLQHPAEQNENRPKSRPVTRPHPNPPPFHLPPTPVTPNRNSARSLDSARRSTSTRPSSTSNNKKSDENNSIVDGMIRYVSSRHGFEVQRYSSKNWLTIDVFSKDACQTQEKPFREMLEKKRQYERLSKSIYSTDYYQKRWKEVIQSYQHDDLDHLQWAQQNYQLLALRTLYTQAMGREYRDRYLDGEEVRRKRAQKAFRKWKKTKDEEILERQRSQLTTAQSERRIKGETSSAMNNSFTIPTTNSVDEMTTTAADTSRRMSFSTSEENDLPTSTHQPAILPTRKPIELKGLYLFDQERWSLQAMLKRVVGLAQPLPEVPKIRPRKQSRMTNNSNDSGFESI